MWPKSFSSDKSCLHTFSRFRTFVHITSWALSIHVEHLWSSKWSGLVQRTSFTEKAYIMSFWIVLMPNTQSVSQGWSNRKKICAAQIKAWYGQHISSFISLALSIIQVKAVLRELLGLAKRAWKIVKTLTETWVLHILFTEDWWSNKRSFKSITFANFLDLWGFLDFLIKFLTTFRPICH